MRNFDNADGSGEYNSKKNNQSDYLPKRIHYDSIYTDENNKFIIDRKTEDEINLNDKANGKANEEANDEAINAEPSNINLFNDNIQTKNQRNLKKLLWYPIFLE
ncbi:hypothetical protein H8356DRAFT_1359261 [Neocallimastix lanati (nom. inval.)]|nr:hypothetical protein H8356DRAFT_1359261 [Neocallimastix sp. JGI-2020a]